MIRPCPSVLPCRHGLAPHPTPPQPTHLTPAAGWIRWVHYLSIFYYAFEAMITGELSGMVFTFQVGGCRAAAHACLGSACVCVRWSAAAPRCRTASRWTATVRARRRHLSIPRC